jgi:receptor protein-tyrosine kinase
MVRFRRKSRLYRKQNAHEANAYLRQLVTAQDPENVASEAYRTLRTNLLYAFVDDPPQAIVLTSPGSREGKSTACANLGTVLSQVGKSVLLLDCDLRNPVQHRIFGLSNRYGIADILAGQRSLPEVWQEPLPGLKVIGAGSIPFDPAGLLSSRGFSRLVEEARRQFDYLLIDSPPIELTSDPAILATKVDGVLLVLDAQRTPRRAFENSVRSLDIVGAKLLGTIMNNVDASDAPYSDYGHYVR